MGIINKMKLLVTIAALTGVDSFQPSRNFAIISGARRGIPSQLFIDEHKPYPSQTTTTALFPAQSGTADSLVHRASKSLKASTWLSWWSQVILTVVSAVTFDNDINIYLTLITFLNFLVDSLKIIFKFHYDFRYRYGVLR